MNAIAKPISLPALRVAPHSTEAEQSVIACVANNNRILVDIDWLSDSDFYVHAHAIIWSRIQAMSMQSQPIDPVLLVTALEQSGELEEAGGADYMVDILMADVGSANAEHYAKVIRDRALSRRMIRIGHEIAELGYSGGEIQSKIDNAQSLTAELEARKTDEPKHINDVLRRTIEGIDRRFNSTGDIVGLETGFADLDKATCGLGAGDMIVIAGRPSMGKSTIAMNIAEHVALADKFVIVYSLEMPDEQLALRSLASIGSIDHGRLRSKPDDSDWPLLNNAMGRLKDRNLYIDDQSILTSSQILSRSRKIAARVGRNPDLVVVDYIQLLADDGEGTQRITKISRNIKLAAKALGCPLIALSQLNRSVESRPASQRRPLMSDLRESGAIEQDADVIIMMYRDEVYNEDSPSKGVAEAIIRKQRNGPLKTIYMQSQLDKSRFRNLENYIPPSDPLPRKGRRYDGYDD